MSGGAASAVEFAADAGIKLDYSLASIKVVEQQLAGLHSQIPAKSPSAQEIRRMSLMFGAYMGEVLKRNYGGSWSKKSALHPGQDILTFHVRGKEVWPHIKAEKRIIDGPEDNVWFYFQTLLKELGPPP